MRREKAMTKQIQPALRRNRLAMAVATTVLASSVSIGVSAQSWLEEVTVTATKRAESVQDVPLAISAFTGDFTKDNNLDDVKDLINITPGITGNSKDSFLDAVSVRGIRTQDFGIGGDPSAAFFKNDFYEGRTGGAVTSLYDMERSEVLRGPQGFLFGRSSIGGAISVHTARPEVGGTNSGYIDVDVGERGHAIVEGAINLPVNDNFAMRIAGYHAEEDGYIKNYSGGDDLISPDKSAIRWSTAYQGEKLSVDTMIEYETRKQSGSVYRAITKGETWDRLMESNGPITLRGGKSDVDLDLSAGEADDSDVISYTVKLTYDLGFAELTSNTGYKDHDYYYSEDYDGTPVNLNNYSQDQTGTYLQQELRLTSTGTDAFSWYAGVSYYKEEVETQFQFQGSEDEMCKFYYFEYYGYVDGTTISDCSEYITGFAPSSDGNLTETNTAKGNYEGWASYVDLSYAFNEQWDASIGVRYSSDDKKFSQNVPAPESELGAFWAYGFTTDGTIKGEETWTDTTARALARFRPNDTAMFFGSYTQGYKPGGFGSFSLDIDDSFTWGDEVAPGDYPVDTFDPETVDSWELGYKDTLFDGQANVTLTAFLYEYRDLQVVVADGGASSVQNAGKVEGKGLEGTITASLGDNFDVYLGAGYLDTEATDMSAICDFDGGCEGASLFWSPEWSGSAVLNAHFPAANGEIIGNLSMTWESERGGGWEQLSETKIDAYQEFNLRFGYRSNDKWSVIGYVENLTDQTTYDGENNNGGIVPAHFFGASRPRTIGVSFGYEWE